MAELEGVCKHAEALIRTHLDPVFGEGSWSFAFDRATRRAGLCNYTVRRISVSRHLAGRCSDEEIAQVVLHEIAHALAGPAAAHGKHWLSIARGIGYTGGRTHQGEIAHELATWLGTCPVGHEHHRFRRPTRMLSCAHCSRRFSRDHLIEWRRR